MASLDLLQLSSDALKDHDQTKIIGMISHSSKAVLHHKLNIRINEDLNTSAPLDFNSAIFTIVQFQKIQSV